MKVFRVDHCVMRLCRISAWALALRLGGALGGLSGTVQAQDQNAFDEPDFIVPARPTVSNPADFKSLGLATRSWLLIGNTEWESRYS